VEGIEVVTMLLSVEQFLNLRVPSFGHIQYFAMK
jgi:hypothetical protein